MGSAQTTLDPRTDRALALAVAIASAVALAALFWPAAARRVFVYGDLGNFFLPLRSFAAEQLARGSTPLWMPHLFCGFYAHGEGQIGLFHPLRWLLYRFLPLGEAFNLECLIPFPVALAGVALFLRRLKLPASAALFGGATFAFSAFMTLRLTHLNAIAVLAHLGWLLLAVDALVRAASRRSRTGAWVAVALLTGSQLLVGYPAAIAYCWLLAIPYALWAASGARSLAPLLCIASALAVGLLLGAIQLVPTWEHLGDSRRAAPSFDYLAELSLHPLNLLSVVSPWLFRNHVFMGEDHDPIEQALCFGSVVPLAAIWVGLRWRQLGAWRPLVVGSSALGALGLVLALGHYTPLYRYFVMLPGVELLRVPARYSFALYAAGALLAAIAFADLARGAAAAPRRRLAWLWAVPAIGWLVAGTAIALRDPTPGPGWLQQLAPLGWIAVGPLTLTAAAALFHAATRGHRAALFGIVALALAEHVAYASSLWWTDPPRTIAAYRAGIVAPPVAPPLRIATPRSWGSFYTRDRRLHHWSATTFVVRDARLVTGYAGLMPESRLDYEQPASLRVAGAAAIVNIDHFEPLAGALARVRLVAQAVSSSQPRRDLAAIDVATAALVEEPLALAEGPVGAARLERDEPGAIHVVVDAPARQLLVLAERFHTGWHASLDGAPARVLRVNGDFMGTVVEAGPHRVEWTFAPRSFAVGRWLSLAGIAIVVAVALTGWRSAERTHAG